MPPVRSKVFTLLAVLVFLSLIGSIVFVAVRLSLLPEDAAYDNTRATYLLMLLQCFLGVVVLFVPGLLAHRLSIEIPSAMYLLYILFLYGAIYLGEVRSFYYRIPGWDSILHMISGGMLGALSFSVVALLNRSERIPMNLTPAFVAVFAFCFSIALGVFWEFYEFAVDSMLGLNMQKFLLEDGTPLVGRDALWDTMKDLMIDAVGGLVMAVLGYISIKHDKGWVEKLQFRKRS